MRINSVGRWGSLIGLALTICLASPKLHAIDLPLTLAFSIGQEMQFKPPPAGQARASSLMISPGYSISDNTRIELGIAYSQDAYRSGEIDLEIRPNLLFWIPGYSYYGRLNLGFVHLLAGEEGEKRPAIGAALGRTIKIGNQPFHGEIGVNPRREKTKKGKFRLFWIAEIRAGLTFDL